MKELPILFSTPMVQAISEDRKKMTRRTSGLEKVNAAPNDYYLQSLVLHATGLFTFAPIEPNGEPLQSRIIECKPRYQVGDVLWVKETYYACGYWRYTGAKTKTGKEKIEFIDVTPEHNEWYCFHDNSPAFPIDKIIPQRETDPLKIQYGWYKRPSLYMPRNVSRTSLKVTEVRCERLHDITNEDALSEGIEWKIKYPEESPDTKYYRDYMFSDRFVFGEAFTAKNSFFTLWESINGKESLNSNPWIWVYKFEKVI